MGQVPGILEMIKFFILKSGVGRVSAISELCTRHVFMFSGELENNAWLLFNGFNLFRICAFLSPNFSNVPSVG